MVAAKVPVTPAVRTLRAAKIPFEPHLYTYEDKGGTFASAQQLGVDEHLVIKTLIMEDEKKSPLVVLMHGDCEVSTKNLARQVGVKTITPCSPETADRHSGYKVGGTSPFGTRKKMPIYIQETIFELERIYINGGKRGFLVALTPRDAQKVLAGVVVDVVA